ncbi:ribonuclease H-like domain-containing protein [Tanacetum coccineum]
MVTHFCFGTNRPIERLNLHVSSVSPLPKSYRDAFNDTNWQNAMRDEYIVLIKNKTWTLVPRPSDTNIMRCMWVFRHKYMADGTLSYYKARLVVNGSTQLEGVDVDETFSAVVKLGTIRTALSLAASRHWPIHQLDVKNAFLHGDLSKTETDTAYLLLYVDDIVLTASSKSLLQQIIRSLHKEFAMTDLGSLNYFLGVSVTRDSSESCGFSIVSLLPDISYVVQQIFFAYCDADWAGCPTTRRSTSGYCVFLANNLLSWCFKRQLMLSCSSAEAEYRGVANAIAETCWIRNLLRELHSLLSSATLVYCDNVSAVYLSCNPVQHQLTKHIKIDIHFVRDLVAAGHVRVLHVSTRYQFADIFTKSLPLALFEEF